MAALPANRLNESGTQTFDGVSPIGSYSGTADDATPAGLALDNTFSDTYSFAADSMPPGRGTLSGNGNILAYIVSATKVLIINKPALKPRVECSRSSRFPGSVSLDAQGVAGCPL